MLLLTHRVMSEIFRDPAVPKGAISVDARAGVVARRAQLGTRAQLGLVEAAFRKVAGARGVDNLPHTPGTLQAAVLEGERAPSSRNATESPTTYRRDNPTT